MSVFSSTWLDLREPVDAEARSAQLVDRVARSCGAGRPLRILDLASGTGANLRYLAPRLGGEQEWTLIDKDPVLIGAIPDRLAAWARTVEAGFIPASAGAMRITAPGFTCRARSWSLDLVNGLYHRDTGDVQLVTASALLDLVSLDWLRALALYCHRRGAAVLFALTYDGRIFAEPADLMDEQVCKLVNRHQRTDKGFGPALGPASVRAVLQLFTELGYRVQAEPSDWHVGAREAPLQSMLVDGWLGAAVEMAPGDASELQAWRRRRGLQIEHSRLQLTVGHVDIAAWLP